MKKHYLPHPNGKAADCIKNRTPFNSDAVEGAFLAMRNFVLFLISKRTMDILSLLRLPSRELLR